MGNAHFLMICFTDCVADVSVLNTVGIMYVFRYFSHILVPL